MSKKQKRKPEIDLESERGLYGSFVSAANSVSHLYTQAIQQNNAARQQGEREALESVLSWACTRFGTSATVPTAALIEYLRHELQNCGSSDALATPTHFPGLMAPPGSRPTESPGDSCDEMELAGEGTAGFHQHPHQPGAMGRHWRSSGHITTPHGAPGRDLDPLLLQRMQFPGK